MKFILITLYLTFIQHKAVPKYHSQWCGFGALRNLTDPTQPAPMAYRVLGYPFRKNIYLYHAFKAVGIFAALFAVWQAFGNTALYVTALVLPFTFWYDCWDWTIEMAGIYFAIAGNLPAAALFALLWGLSRETAPLSGVVYWLAGGDIVDAATVGMIAIGAKAAVYAWQGIRPLYCDRFMIRVNNALLMKGSERARISVVVILLAVAGVVVHGQVYGLIPLVLIVAGVTMGKLDETRLFSSAVPFIAFLMKG
jgi:hypothetical protein